MWWQLLLIGSFSAEDEKENKAINRNQPNQFLGKQRSKRHRRPNKEDSLDIAYRVDIRL